MPTPTDLAWVVVPPAVAPVPSIATTWIPLAQWQGATSTHPFPDVCGPDEDANSNGIADRTEQVGTAASGASHCGECGDVCDRSAPQASMFECVRLTTGIEGTCRPVCDQPTQFFDCDGLPDNGCEAEVTDVAQLFVPDCDGIGSANSAPQFDCIGEGTLTIFIDVDGDDGTDDRRNCEVVQAVVTEGSGFGADCADGDPAVSPSAAEVCDGIDNDCDGATDPYTLFQLSDSCTTSDAAVMGTCRAGAVRVCDDAGGVTCQPALPSVELCDGLDNNCDGLIDNLGAPSVENRLGEACRASEDPGPCGAGALSCQGGGLVCSPALLPERDPAGDGVDADCDGVDADSERAIFVAVGGATVQGSGPALGSPQNPVGTLARAYELVRVREASPVPVEQVILASGSYTVPHGITLPGSGFTISGGWTRDVARNVWTPATTGRSTVEIGSVCRCEPAIDSTGTCVQAACEPVGGYVAAIGVQNPAGVRLANLDLVVAAQPAARGPVVGLACTAEAVGATGAGTCAGLSLEQVSLEMANAQAGEPHAAPAAAENGRSSVTLLGARCGPDGCSIGGLAGGGSSCGAQGGDGAGFLYDRVLTCTAPFGGTVQYNPVAPATAGSPAPLGGGGGVSGFLTSACQPIVIGSIGGRGQTRASAGSGGVAGTGASASSPLQPVSGTAGTPGLPGGGGGGGGGLPLFGGDAVYGGGGSSGGCGGNGGAPGFAGGTVIGLLIDDPSTSPVFSSVTIRVGSGGAGGAGQSGGVGGLGTGPVVSPSTLGGASGHGAGGGGGGGGAGGSSIGIARWPAVPVLITPAVGTAGVGGAGGAAGAGGTGGIFITTDPASVVFETAAAGQPGTRGTDGVSASFCSLAPGAPPAGEVACR